MKKQRSGFTLVELVVVVMILGILAAVAAPRLLETSEAATENGARQTLAVIRDAIERYAADNGGELPGELGTSADFTDDLEPYLRGPFPACPVGAHAGDALVSIVTAGSPVVDGGTNGWAYSNDTGEFIINDDGMDSQDVAFNTY